MVLAKMERGQKAKKKKRNSNDTEISGGLSKKKRGSKDTGIRGGISKLPGDIVMDILSRLPAKALFNCRWVCKSWLTLVRDPHLVKMHLTRASLNQTTPPSILFHSSLNLYLLHNLEESNPPIKLRFPFMLPGLSLELVGSCNGLVCARDSSEPNPFIYIFNPVTGDHVQLPKPIIDPRTCQSELAFCYHPPTNDYKVLRFARDDGWCEAEIFTLKSNSWRKIKGLESLCFVPASVVVNGAIHWFSYGLKMSTPPLIKSFDVGEEEFRVFECPAQLPPGYGYEKNFGVLGGCLAIFYSCPYDQNIFVVWVMKEYGVNESWTKQVYIKETGMLEGNWNNIRPLCILKNGKFLLAHSNRLLLSYDLESKVVMPVEIPGFPFYPLWDEYKSITHVGTLVSPRTNNGGVEGQ